MFLTVGARARYQNNRLSAYARRRFFFVSYIDFYNKYYIIHDSLLFTGERRMREHIKRVKEVSHNLTEKTQRVMRRLIILIILLIASVPLMWLVNITGHREWNFVPFFLGAVVILLTALRFDTILFAFGAGTLHGTLTNGDLSQGVQSGVRTWRKITTGTLSIFWTTAGLLTVHPWHESPMSFWVLAAAILVVVSFLEYHELKLRALKLTLIFGYAGAVSIYSLINTIPSLWQGKVFNTITGEPLVMMEPDGSWIDYDHGPKDCMSGCYSPYTGKRLIPITPKVAQKHGLYGLKREPNVVTPTEPIMIHASNSGQIIAPTSHYAWLSYPTNRCYRWWVVEAPNGNLVETLYRERSTGKIVPMPPNAASGQGWISKVGRPVRIEYESSTRGPDGSCEQF